MDYGRLGQIEQIIKRKIQLKKLQDDLQEHLEPSKPDNLRLDLYLEIE